jgi:DNA-binding GntR family transcriptional regulator
MHVSSSTSNRRSSETASLARTNVAQEVAAVLREDILRARIEPGSHLRQEQVAARFGVSTTPVREAFRHLEAEGLVRLDPGKGVLVFRPGIDDVREAYEIREALETLAVRFAVVAMTDDDIARLSSLLDEMDRTEDTIRWVELNNMFHDMVYAPAGRPKLRAMILTVRDSMSGYMHSAIQQALPSGRAAREHQEILAACRARDVGAAQRAVAIHLHHTVDMALEYLAPEEVVS